MPKKKTAAKPAASSPYTKTKRKAAGRVVYARAGHPGVDYVRVKVAGKMVFRKAAGVKTAAKKKTMGGGVIGDSTWPSGPPVDGRVLLPTPSDGVSVKPSANAVLRGIKTAFQGTNNTGNVLRNVKGTYNGEDGTWDITYKTSYDPDLANVYFSITGEDLSTDLIKHHKAL